MIRSKAEVAIATQELFGKREKQFERPPTTTARADRG